MSSHIPTADLHSLQSHRQSTILDSNLNLHSQAHIHLRIHPQQGNQPHLLRIRHQSIPPTHYLNRMIRIKMLQLMLRLYRHQIR
jgi:hypothetical protein